MKKIILTACTVLLSISLIQAQEGKEEKGKISKPEKLNIKVKDGAKPDIYVDGEKFDFPMDILDPNRIESVNVIKGERATKEYNAKNGVIIIITKEKEAKVIKAKTRVEYGNPKGTPLIIIDGDEGDQETFKKLSPDDVETIKILKKGEEALKKYNASNGVIIITTKKGKKK